MRAIRRLVVEPVFEAFNYSFLEHEGAAASTVRSALLTLPMMAASRLVVVRDPAELQLSRGGRRPRADQPEEGEEEDSPAAGEADAAGGPDSSPEPPPLSPSENVQRWAALLADVPPESRLVLTLGWELPETSPLLKAASKLTPPADIIRCFPATPKSAETWVRKMVSEQGGSIDAQASQALVLRSGSSLLILDQEIRKLLAYAGDRITIAHVLEAATPSAEASVFEMVDHVGNRRPYQAVQKLRRLIEQGESPLGLMAMVTRQVRLVFITREMLAAGSSVRDVEKRLGLPTWVVANYLSQARNFDRPQLVAMMRSLGRMDLDVKTGRQDPAEALELFILRQG